MAIINGEPGASKISVRVKLTANFRRQNERSSSYVRCITKPCSTPTLHSDVRCSFLKIFPFPKGNLFPGMATPLSRSGSAGHRVNRKYCISQRTDGREEGGRWVRPMGATLLSAGVRFDAAEPAGDLPRRTVC
jgi:hypothetical protein